MARAASGTLAAVATMRRDAQREFIGPMLTGPRPRSRQHSDRPTRGARSPPSPGRDRRPSPGRTPVPVAPRPVRCCNRLTKVSVRKPRCAPAFEVALAALGLGDRRLGTSPHGRSRARGPRWRSSRGGPAGRRRAAGSVSTMRSVSSSPALLRIALSAWTRSSTRPSRRRSSSSSMSKATLMPSSSAIAQPRQLTRSPLDDVVGLEHLAGDAEAAVLERLDVAALERGADVGQAAEPSRGPSTRRFGSSARRSRGLRRTRPP